MFRKICFWIQEFLWKQLVWAWHCSCNKMPHENLWHKIIDNEYESAQLDREETFPDPPGQFCSKHKTKKRLERSSTAAEQQSWGRQLRMSSTCPECCFAFLLCFHHVSACIAVFWWAQWGGQEASKKMRAGVNVIKLFSIVDALVLGILKGEVSLYHWPPVCPFWISQLCK